MAKLSRVGDQNTTGGKIMTGSPTVFANGIAVGLHMSQITPHAPFGKPRYKKLSQLITLLVS